MSGYQWAGDTRKISQQTRNQTARKERLIAQYEKAKHEADQ